MRPWPLHLDAPPLEATVAGREHPTGSAGEALLCRACAQWRAVPSQALASEGEPDTDPACSDPPVAAGEGACGPLRSPEWAP